MRLEDYAIVGDTQTVALIGSTGSVDWLCFPRFDSGACFAALLGTPNHGRWLLAPRGEPRGIRRRYRHDTMILETELDTDEGTVRLIDFMPIRGRAPDLVRIVEGVRGRVPIQLELIVRYDYGAIVPWVRREAGRLHAVAGPDALVLATPAALEGRGLTTVAELTVERGDRVPFTLTWHPSYEPMPDSPDPMASLEDTEAWWRYPTGKDGNIDGLPGGEGAFLACSFWLVDVLVLAGRRDDARALFDRLLAIRNDVGLLSEQYDTRRRRLVGNFPQAFSHVALVNSARNLSVEHGPAKQRSQP